MRHWKTLRIPVSRGYPRETLWIDFKGEMRDKLGVQLEYSRKREDLRLHAIPRKKTSGLKACLASPKMSYIPEESLGVPPLGHLLSSTSGGFW